MEVYGRTGYVITVGRDDLSVRLEGNPEAAALEAKTLAPPYDDSLSYLRAVIVEGLKPDGLSSLDTNLVVTEILDAARQSASSGKTVRLAPSQ